MTRGWRITPNTIIHTGAACAIFEESAIEITDALRDASSTLGIKFHLIRSAVDVTEPIGIDKGGIVWPAIHKLNVPPAWLDTEEGIAVSESDFEGEQEAEIIGEVPRAQPCQKCFILSCV